MPNSPPPDRAFVAFSLGPVQSFIASARTVRDLWSGSYLLSWLTFHAMEPVFAESSAQLVFPDMSDHPLRRPGKDKAKLEPCLPNRFLAEVDAERARDLAGACVDACRKEWSCLSEKVRARLHELHGDPTLAAGDTLWRRQVESFFDITAVVLPFADCTRERLKTLLGAEPKDGEDALWTARWQAVMKLLASARSVRHFPNYDPPLPADGRWQQKCSLLGTYEHIGSGDFNQARTFWEQARERWDVCGTRVGKRERLCAVSLVKRFAWPLVLAAKLEFPPRAMRFDDTATVAAAMWLRDKPALQPDAVRNRDRDWSGQWLYWSSKDQDKDEDERAVPDDLWNEIQLARGKGGPPPYYAILMMDGDRMGDHLKKATRSDHGLISGALANFALHLALDIVETKHHGQLIYAGGDDVLALLPTETALACGQALNKAFGDNWNEKKVGGDAATVSAGLVVVHYKEDLRFALDQARQAEREAKDGGRDALQVRVCRRSGEHSSARCPWDFVSTVDGWVSAFRNDASDRWAYRLKDELPTLRGLPAEAMKAEIKRQVGRSDEPTRWALADGAGSAGDMIAGAFEDYRKLVPSLGDGQALELFVTLCQTASFLARGRDA